MTLRDDLLPVVDLGSQLSAAFGLSRFAVTLRRRVWSGARVGEGTPTNQDVVISPPPSVNFISPFARQMEAIMASGGSIRDRYYKISDLTPFYVNSDGTTGGHTPHMLNMRAAPGQPNVDPIIVLVGDDGMMRECTMIILEDDDPFNYQLTVQERDGVTVPLVSLAVTPNPAAVAVGAKLQLVAQGTFLDGSVCDVSNLMKWTSSAPLNVSVDLLGVASGMGAGTSQVTAALVGIVSPALTVTAS